MIQSYDDEAMALVSFYFPGIQTLTLSDTGCKQWLGHEDDWKRYPLLDFSRIDSLAWTQCVFALVSSPFSCTHTLHLDLFSHHCRLDSPACMHFRRILDLVVLVSILLHARTHARTSPGRLPTCLKSTVLISSSHCSIPAYCRFLVLGIRHRM